MKLKIKSENGHSANFHGNIRKSAKLWVANFISIDFDFFVVVVCKICAKFFFLSQLTIDNHFVICIRIEKPCNMRSAKCIRKCALRKTFARSYGISEWWEQWIVHIHIHANDQEKKKKGGKKVHCRALISLMGREIEMHTIEWCNKEQWKIKNKNGR